MSYADFSERGRNKNARSALGRGRGCAWDAGVRVRTAARTPASCARQVTRQVTPGRAFHLGPKDQSGAVRVGLGRTWATPLHAPPDADLVVCLDLVVEASPRPAEVARRRRQTTTPRRVRDDWERGGTAPPRKVVEKICLRRGTPSALSGMS